MQAQRKAVIRPDGGRFERKGGAKALQAKLRNLLTITKSYACSRGSPITWPSSGTFVKPDDVPVGAQVAVSPTGS